MTTEHVCRSAPCARALHSGLWSLHSWAEGAFSLQQSCSELLSLTRFCPIQTLSPEEFFMLSGDEQKMDEGDDCFSTTKKNKNANSSVSDLNLLVKRLQSGQSLA